MLATACLSEPLRKKMADALGLYDMRFEVGYDPYSDQAQQFAEELLPKAEALLLTKTTEDWIQILDSAGVPCGPVLFTEELLEHEQVIANDLVVELEHSKVGNVRMVGPILQMTDTPLEAKSAAPALGENTDEVLGSLGYSLDEIQRFRDDGVTR